MPLDTCIPLIISGAPRSGTSLFYNLFDGHPAVSWLADEGFLFEYLYDLGDSGADLLLDAIPLETAALLRGIRDKQVMPPLHEPYRQSPERGSMSKFEIAVTWDEQKFREALERPHDRSIGSLWTRLASACLAGLGQPVRRYACMKSPDFGKSSASALQHVPQARAVVIVRDPLYSIDSLKRSRELRGTKLLSWPLLAQTVRQFQLMHERIKAAPTERLRVVRYETLVSDTPSVMRSLADWLGIEFLPCLLEPTMHGRSWPGISSFEPTDGVQSGPASRNIQALDKAEQHYLRAQLAPLREAFSYE